MSKTPIPEEIVREQLKISGIQNVSTASIREMKRLINMIEGASGVRFVRMEMGIPGLKPVSIGVQAQIEALQRGVAATYPEIEGLPVLKNEISRFCKNFINIDVDPKGCIPSVGSMQASFAVFLTLPQLHKGKDTTLFIDPGFPVQKSQHHILGNKYETFDVYHYRDEALREKLESYLSKGNIHSIIYSNPNNPSWICFTEKELRIIAEVAAKYDVIVIEDLAYFGMDFRQDISKPGVPPYQPSIAHYYDKYILMISGSKAFSYAGERIGALIIANAIFEQRYPDLIDRFGTDNLAKAFIFGTTYCLSSGVAHSVQYAMAAILKACNDGTYNFVEPLREYEYKAHEMKQMFVENGFKIVYDHDGDQALADGFYFTIRYPGMSSEELLREFLFYGISAISLKITGSDNKDGLRACVSLIQLEELPVLKERLQLFYENHK